MAANADRLENAANNFSDLGVTKQLIFIVALAAAIALGVYVVLWSRTPEMTPLYAHLEGSDAAEIIEALEKNGIKYQFDSGKGMIIVPTDKVHDVRMKMAAQGLPKGSGQGYELLDKAQGFGTSQFMESVRFKRSLEGELSRTISSLDHVRSARVHLGLPRQSSFLRRSEASSASVMVDLQGSGELERDQVMGIVHLVASSVPGLDQKSVTVVNQYGHLLTQSGKSKVGLALEELSYMQQKEKQYADKIRELLTPIFGLHAVRAEVSAEIDFTSTETTKELYDSAKPKVRSEALVAESKGFGDIPQGVPGALSNQPPALTSAPETQGDNAEGETSGKSEEDKKPISQSSQQTRNYELDKSITHIKNPTGVIKRLSVAVVIDDKVSYDAAGNATRTPLTEEELTRVEALVKGAIGLNDERGDSISVVNSSFAQAPPIPAAEEVPLLKQPWLIPVIKQILAGLFILVVLFTVIRPTLRQLFGPKAKHRDLNEEESEEPEPVPKLELPAPDRLSEQRISQVKNIAHDDSKRAAQVIMNWVGTEDD